MLYRPFGRSLRSQRLARLMLIVSLIVASHLLNASTLTEATLRSVVNGVSQQESSIASLHHRPSASSSYNSRDSDLEAAFKTLLDLHPLESTIQYLLSPIASPGGGNKGLFDVGERTRQYAVFFQAWTDLNLVRLPDGRIEIRDNILQYLRTHFDFARTLGNSPNELIHFYEAFQQFIYMLGDHLFPFTPLHSANHMIFLKQFSSRDNRGIVLTGGNTHIAHLLTNVATLRRLGCHLPIEILYLGEDDLCYANRVKLEELPGVVTRDLSRALEFEDWDLDGFHIKPFAILFSSFRQVIFIDADALFFKDPTALLDDPGFIVKGALFFKDRMLFPEHKRGLLKQLLPSPISDSAKASRFWTGKSGHYQESGVVVVDKWRHFIPLMFTCRMNGLDRADASKFMYGDKESFWLSWEMTSSTYDMHNGSTGAMGSFIPSFSEELYPKDNSKRICSAQLLHADRDGKPLWFNGWIAKSRHLDSEVRRVSSFNAYVYEPTDAEYEPAIRGEDEPWQYQAGNCACLSSDTVYDLSEDEKSLLEFMVQEARKAGAID